MKGWVYIISNKAMPGLVKVGYSDRDPLNRARELNSTASPHPHVVEFAILVEQPKQVERSSHQKLKGSHEGKEWFRCTVELAKSVILNDQTDPVITHGKKGHITPKPQQKEVLKTIDSNLPRCKKCGVSIQDRGSILTVDNLQVCRRCFDSADTYGGLIGRLFRR